MQSFQTEDCTFGICDVYRTMGYYPAKFLANKYIEDRTKLSPLDVEEKKLLSEYFV